MALTELQLPAKADFYSTLRNAATEMNNLMHKWGDLSESINTMDSGDLDAMGVPSGQVRSDMVNFKILLNEMVGFFNGTSTSRTNVPAAVVDRLRAIK